jgi:hypothetical protein
MLLGDILARFEDDACAAEALLELDDIVLANRVASAAGERGMTLGEFAVQSVGRFVQGASDEEWLTLIGLMSRAENPAQAFLRRVLSGALATRPEE